MSENLGLNEDQLSNLRIQSLNKLFQSFENNSENDFKYETIDKGDRSELSETEHEIMKKLSEVTDKKKFIKDLIDASKTAFNQKRIKHSSKMVTSKINQNTESSEISLEEKKHATITANNLGELKEDFGDVHIGDYSAKNALIALKILNDGYKTYDSGLNGFNSTINGIDNKSELNDFQNLLIEKILGSNKGFNNTYIKGFNSEKGNFLVKVDNFKSDLRNGKYKMTGEKNDPSVVNSLLLSSYILKIKEEGNLDKVYLEKNIDVESIKELNNILSDEYKNDTNILRTCLKNENAFNPLKKALNEIVFSLSEESQEAFNSEKYNKTDNDFFLKNQDKITFITDKDKLIEIAKAIHSNKEGNGSLDIKYINKRLLRKDPEILLEKDIFIGINDDSVSLVPKELISKDHIADLCKKYMKHSNYFLIQAVKNDIGAEAIDKALKRGLAFESKTMDPRVYEISEVIIKYLKDAKMMKGNKKAYNEYLKKEESDFLKSYNKLEKYDVKNEESLEKDLESVVAYAVNNSDSSKTLFQKLIKDGFLGNKDEIKKVCGSDKDTALTMLSVKGGSENIKFIDPDILVDEDIIKEIFTNEKIDDSLLVLYFENANITSINEILTIYKYYTESNSSGISYGKGVKGNNEMFKKNKIEQFIYSSKYVQNVIYNAKGKVDDGLKEYYKELEPVLEKVTKKINSTDELGEKLSKIVQTDDSYSFSQSEHENETIEISSDDKINYISKYLNSIFEKNGIKTNKETDSIIKFLSSGNAVLVDEGGKRLNAILEKNGKSEIFEEVINQLLELENEEINKKIANTKRGFKSGLNELPSGNKKINTVNSTETNNDNKKYDVENINIAIASIMEGKESFGEEDMNKIIKELENKGIKVDEKIKKYISKMANHDLIVIGYIRKNKKTILNTDDLIIIEKELEKKGIILEGDDKTKLGLLNELIGKVKFKEQIKERLENKKSYVRYLSNPTQKGSFDDYLKEEKANFKSETNESQYSNVESIGYIPSKIDGGYTLKGKNGESIPGLVISEKEKNLCLGNIETTENLINFYETLTDVGLGKLWNERESIFTVISAVKGVGFNIDDDYLGKNETKVFLNCILKSVGETEIDMVFTVESFKDRFKNKNGIQSSGETMDVNSFGESNIENKFIEKFMPSNRGKSLVEFEHKAFKKAIEK